jgi:Na+/phosphate symporter
MILAMPDVGFFGALVMLAIGIWIMRKGLKEIYGAK